MIGLKLDEAKSKFFDKAFLRGKISATEKAILSKFGAFVRQRAISSMLGHKVRSGFGVKSNITNRQGSSPPGQPPAPHTGLLVKTIAFIYEDEAHSVIIGPPKLNMQGDAPAALEHGGKSVITVGPPDKREQVSVFIRPHPYMGPAGEAELERLPSMWRDSIR